MMTGVFDRHAEISLPNCDANEWSKSSDAVRFQTSRRANKTQAASADPPPRPAPNGMDLSNVICTFGAILKCAANKWAARVMRLSSSPRFFENSPVIVNSYLSDGVMLMASDQSVKATHESSK